MVSIPYRIYVVMFKGVWVERLSMTTYHPELWEENKLESLIAMIWLIS